MKKEIFLPLILFIGIVLIFFRSFFIQNLVPIPTDLLIGLYHPFRDLYAKDYPRGIPFKNPLIGDPVTQQTIWRELSMSELGKGNLPLWNPYQMAGYPLMANVQSAPFYPLNILFVLFPFLEAWSISIILQPLMALLFMYLFLRSLKQGLEASVLGAIVFAFSGFMVSWLEWGTIVSTALWFPLILYSIDRIGRDKRAFKGVAILLIAIIASFLAGHTQTFFYGSLLTFSYAFFRLFELKDKKKYIITLLTSSLLIILFMLPFLLQQMQFLALSGRGLDQNYRADGWFIPFMHSVQFLVPNFFGNPATGNYWGIFNYGEFLGYVGVLPFILFLQAVIFKRDKVVYFFTLVLLLSLLIAFPTPISKIIFKIGIPFLTSAQPTRLLFLVDFALAVLAAFGLDQIIRSKKISLIPLIITTILFSVVVATTYFLSTSGVITSINYAVTLRNLVIPIFFLLVSVSVLFIFKFVPKKAKQFLIYFLILLTFCDLFQVASKYNTFSKKEYFFPQTKVITFLQKNTGINRIMILDRRIMHPNIPTMYRLQSVDGYDPLYLFRYGELFATAGRMEPDIQSPFGYFRILTTEHHASPVVNLLGVKYILSLTDLRSINLKKVYEEGETKVYENLSVLPRAFFVKSVSEAKNKQEAINFLFKEDLSENAVVEGALSVSGKYSLGQVSVNSYQENRVEIKTANAGKGFLVLTDTFYPTWMATIDGVEVEIIRSDFNFRGIVVPEGEHVVVFANRFLSL